MSCSPLYDSCMASCLRLDAEHGNLDGEANPDTGPVATGASVKQPRVYRAQCSACGVKLRAPFDSIACI